MSTRTFESASDSIAIDIEAFDRITAELGFATDAARARALDMDHGVISRLRSGQNRPGPKFIARSLALGIPFAAVFKRVAS